MPETHVFLRAQSAQETWDLPKIQLKVLPHLQGFDLKSPNNSSAAFSYISSTGTEFAIFSCSCVCRTRHSSPISAPHAAHVPHKMCSQSLPFLCTGEICPSLISSGLRKPLALLPHPLVPCTGSCQAQKGPGRPLLMSSNTSLAVKLSPVFLRHLLGITYNRQPQIHW